MIAVKEKAAWRDPALGAARELDLPQGRLRYFETGSGPRSFSCTGCS